MTLGNSITRHWRHLQGSSGLHRRFVCCHRWPRRYGPCRLQALTLRNLHRLAMSAIRRRRDDWESRIYGRLSVLPDTAEPLQRAQLMAALSVGGAIIQLCSFAHRLNISTELDEPHRAM
jgi:hypothetical protein